MGGDSRGKKPWTDVIRLLIRQDMKLFFALRTVKQDNGELWIYLDDKLPPTEPQLPKDGQPKLVYKTGPKPDDGHAGAIEITDM